MTASLTASYMSEPAASNRRTHMAFLASDSLRKRDATGVPKAPGLRASRSRSVRQPGARASLTFRACQAIPERDEAKSRRRALLHAPQELAIERRRDAGIDAPDELILRDPQAAAGGCTPLRGRPAHGELVAFLGARSLSRAAASKDECKRAQTPHETAKRVAPRRASGR